MIRATIMARTRSCIGDGFGSTSLVKANLTEYAQHGRYMAVGKHADDVKRVLKF